MAHMDEVAMMVTHLEPDGLLKVDGLGGTSPAKLGEGPVDVLTSNAIVTGILSMGSIHSANTSRGEHPVRQPTDWEGTRVFTGWTLADLELAGVRPGSSVCISRSRKGLLDLGSFVGSYALDNRAPLAILLQLSNKLRENTLSFRTYLAATVSEELGGHGARYLGQRLNPTITIALDVLPVAGEDASGLNSMPGAWVRDSRSVYDRRELECISHCFDQLGFKPHWVLGPSGATDASFLALSGNTARAVALGIPVANTHGFEILHKDAPNNLLKLLLAYFTALDNDLSELSSG
jgi:putative aminopeptidase FrvX